MLIALIIVSIICIISFLLYFQLRLEIKSLKNQLKYTKEENSTFTLFTNSSDTTIKDIFDEINLMKRAMKEEKQQHFKKEKEIKEMITNISHDIRTPLTSIQGYLEMMETSDDVNERERYYQIIVRRLDDFHSLLDEFFVYTKLINASEEMLLTSQAIYPLVCHSLLNYMNLLQEHDLVPQMMCEDEALMANIHEESFHRICMNLIINTIRYGEKPFIISIKKEAEKIIVCFQNNCNPSNIIDCDHMFDRFYKEDSARTQKGSGLGLAIVKELIDRMHGSVIAKQVNNTISIVLTLPIISE